MIKIENIIKKTTLRIKYSVIHYIKVCRLQQIYSIYNKIFNEYIIKALQTTLTSRLCTRYMLPFSNRSVPIKLVNG